MCVCVCVCVSNEVIISLTYVGAYTCPPNFYQCQSLRKNKPICLRQIYVCDGIVNCKDALDEKNCSRSECDASQFRCAFGLCINKNFYCDHDDDCGDGSDEPSNCSKFRY